MRALALLSTTFALLHTSHSTADLNLEARQYLDQHSSPLLVKRQSCPSDHTSCSSLGDAAACCPNNTQCARDQAGQIACCPIGAKCVGVLGTTLASGASSTTPFVLGGTTTTSAQATFTQGYSTVPNAYYPFILIPTSYSNSQLCLNAYTACQSASTACFNSLNGQNGVTISGIGTQGLTQPGITGTIAAGASSICSSLSQEGCYGIQSTQCSQFGSAGATATTGFVGVAGNGAHPAVARCTGAMYTAAAAAMAGAGIARLAMA